MDGLTILKTTKSAFTGYIKDRLTTLKPATDRIFGTCARITWDYGYHRQKFAEVRTRIIDTLLREFAARGSIARTAEALGYTPSAVSQQLAVLEREAGTPLLDRTARSAGLTDAGRRLAVHAERILAMVEEAESYLSAQAAQPSGRVVVTAFPSAAVAFAHDRFTDRDRVVGHHKGAHREPVDRR